VSALLGSGIAWQVLSWWLLMDVNKLAVNLDLGYTGVPIKTFASTALQVASSISCNWSQAFSYASLKFTANLT
jgi:hypothetical protein